MKSKSGRTLAEYLKLNYAIELKEDREQGGYFAHNPELDGCFSQGETPDEAVRNLADAREAWLSVRLEDSLPIPEPAEEQPSGKVLVRMASWLHAALLRSARHQQVSLNQLVVSALAAFVGAKEAQPTTSPELDAKVDALAALAKEHLARIEALNQRVDTLTRSLQSGQTGHLPYSTLFRTTATEPQTEPFGLGAVNHVLSVINAGVLEEPLHFKRKAVLAAYFYAHPSRMFELSEPDEQAPLPKVIGA
jgi:predicted RNase H-like HicB family nuclease